MNQKELIVTLYNKYLDNNASAKEIKELFRILANSTPSEIEDLADLGFLKEVDGTNPTNDEQARLDRIYNGILEMRDDHVDAEVFHKSEGLRTGIFKRLRPVVRYAIAASVFLAIGLTFYFNYKTVDNSVDQSLVGNDVKPGGNKAVLTLADGSKIDLSDSHNGIVIGSDIKYTDGSLVTQGDGKESSSTMLSLSTPRGGQYQVILSDGTKVWLNAVSNLKYPSQFSGNQREVEIQGEAYFEVHKDAKKPFIVHTKGQIIQVLGTHFNVNTYADETATRTTLVEGSVAVQAINGEKRMLKPNQQAIQQAGGIEVIAVEAEEYTAWTKGEIVLTNAELPAILRQLERWYDVSFDEPPATLTTKSVFGVLDRNLPLNDILTSLEKTYKINFKTKGRRISIAVK